MKEIYSGAQQLEEGKGLGKCRKVSSRIQKKDECRNKKTGEVILSREKGL